MQLMIKNTSDHARIARKICQNCMSRQAECDLVFFPKSGVVLNRSLISRHSRVIIYL